MSTVKNGLNSLVVAVPSYTILKPGSSNVNMNIRNLTSRKMMVKAKLIMTGVAAANVITPFLAQENSKKNGIVKQENRIPPSKL